MIVVIGILCLAVGFGAAWLIGKILASKEFDMLQAQEEQKHQELINQFNEVINDKEEIIEELKEQIHQQMKGDKA